jgi:pimeloyl-ACP methyl ester carboxylesterase
MNSPSTLTSLLSTLASTPIDAYKGTIASCLAYRSHPDPSLVSDPSLDRFSHGVGSREAGGIPSSAVADEAFFLGEAMKGEPEWQGKLMADHTALDWRDCIIANLGPGSGSRSRVLVVASRRSGCFEPCGPLWVRDAVNGDGEGGGGEQKGEGGDRRAEGVTVDWGGHWCFWEDPGKFNALALEFLGKPAWRPAGGG